MSSRINECRHDGCLPTSAQKTGNDRQRSHTRPRFWIASHVLNTGERRLRRPLVLRILHPSKMAFNVMPQRVVQLTYRPRSARRAGMPARANTPALRDGSMSSPSRLDWAKRPRPNVSPCAPVEQLLPFSAVPGEVALEWSPTSSARAKPGNCWHAPQGRTISLLPSTMSSACPALVPRNASERGVVTSRTYKIRERADVTAMLLRQTFSLGLPNQRTFAPSCSTSAVG